jgi:Ca2+-binding EF-hand superfamily protein
MREVNEIMIQYGSNDALSLYKKLDFDENTSIDKKELLTGFGKLGIFLTHQELDMIWNEIVGGNPQIKEFTFTQFRAFYNKHKYYPENTSTSKINY